MSSTKTTTTITTKYTQSNEQFRQRYMVHSLIRNSTNGVIYAAVDQATRTHVVMKQIKKSSKLNGRMPREIIMHMHATNKVGAGIVKLHEWYERQKTYVMVLERPANSIDLFEFCKTHGPLSEALARFVFQQVFTTVYRLKQAGITHHDIKDENVLINVQTLEAKVIDFGCARPVSNAPCSSLIGTPEFFPPEWYQYGHYTQDGATVWSLGCLLYVLLFSTPPFTRAQFKQHSSSSDSIKSDSVSESIRERVHVQNALSPVTFDLLCSMLAPNPTERPSLEELMRHPFWIAHSLPMLPFTYSMATSILV